MKRIYLIMVALSGSFTLGACEELPELELETHIDIDVGNTGNTGNTGGSTITIGGDKEAPEEDYPFEYEEILSVENIISSTQGGDCWGDYFFQFTTNNKQVRVYDLALKRYVQTIYIPANQQGFVPNCHSNTACFGTEYYQAEDLFPLIYVSTGYAADDYTGALVYRITQNSQGRFSVTLVQTIRFPKLNSSWTEFVPAGDCAYLCYTSDQVIFQVKMPKLCEGDIVIDPRKDAIKILRFPQQPDRLASSRKQDHLYNNGRVIFITGVPQSGNFSGLVILNLDECSREHILDFKKNGLTSEPESLFVWQGDLCVAFKDRIVKLFL